MPNLQTVISSDGQVSVWNGWPAGAGRRGSAFRVLLVLPLWTAARHGTVNCFVNGSFSGM